MGKSSIEWTDATWNPVRGCTRVSEGCRNCYAEHQAMRITRFDRGLGKPEGEGAYDGLVTMTSQGPKWTGEVRFVEDKIFEPTHWKRPRRVFVNSMSDLFHEKLTFGRISQVFSVMDHARQHTFQVLTKRPERMLQYIDTFWASGAPPNVWLGVSIENQATAEQRIPLLLNTPAAVRFISAEPLLGEVDLCFGSEWALGTDTNRAKRHVDWVIVGGESGRGARLMKADWALSLRDQCQDARVPFFFKQWGGADKKEAGRLLGGREWNEFPAEVAA